MLTPSQLIYSRFRALPEHGEGACYFCGGVAYAPAPTSPFIKNTFTDFNAMRGNYADGVCCACAWFLQDRNPELQAMLGRDKPQRPRNYSFIVDGDGALHILTKGQKTVAAHILRAAVPPVAIIAVSGQKHLFFKARANVAAAGAGSVTYEEQTFRMEAAKFADLYGHAMALYQGGFSKEGIETGRYKFYPDSDLALWREHEDALRPYRGNMTFKVAVYLCQTEKDKEPEIDGQETD